MIGEQLQAKYKIVIFLFFSFILSGCQSYTEDGKQIYNHVEEACIHGVTYYKGLRSLALAVNTNGDIILCGK